MKDKQQQSTTDSGRCCATVVQRFVCGLFIGPPLPFQCKRRGRHKRWGRHYCWQHVKRARPPDKYGQQRQTAALDER